MTNEPKLKPCPFCGGEAKHHHDMFPLTSGKTDSYGHPVETGYHHRDIVQCSCGATVFFDESGLTGNSGQAIKAWNTRPNINVGEIEAIYNKCGHYETETDGVVSHAKWVFNKDMFLKALAEHFGKGVK